MPYVYILASINRVLYVGSSDDVAQRVQDHRAGRGANFTKRYRVHRLVYVEVLQSRSDARTRELEIKGWRREKKVALIQSINPEWLDLVPPTHPDRAQKGELERRWLAFQKNPDEGEPWDDVKQSLLDE